jgi:hypothetical protein
MNERLHFKKNSVHEGSQQSPDSLLWRIGNSRQSIFKTVLKTFGLKHPQFVVLVKAGRLTRKGDLVSQMAIRQIARLDPETNSQNAKNKDSDELFQKLTFESK